jgi:hypothetical protein
MAGIVTIVILVGLGVSTLLNEPPPEDNNTLPPINTNKPDFFYPINEDQLNRYAANIQSGGVPPDGIPPIEEPVFWDVDKADDYLAPGDIVFGFDHNGEIYAFPQRILVWHEIVNLVVGGEQISLTYCPLTGSSLAFRGDIETTNTTLGVSGKLLNSNLVMYDRNTTSWWPQIHSQAVTGSQRGVRLQRLHVTWTTWALWKAAFPSSLVLSTTTGYTRNYQHDPYGSYNDTDSYYQKGGPFFPVMNEDDRLSDKTVVIGIDTYYSQYAVEKESLRMNKVLNLEVGNESVVALYNANLDDVRVFSRTLNDTTYTFEYTDGAFYDQETSTPWSKYGMSQLGALTPIDSFDVMWFAWAAFYPNTGLTCVGCE